MHHRYSPSSSPTQGAALSVDPLQPAVPSSPRHSDSAPTSTTSLLPATGRLRRAAAVIALILPSPVLVVSAFSSGKIEPHLVQGLAGSREDLLSLCFLLASLCGCPVAVKIGEVYGKRRALELCCLVGMAGQLLTVIAPWYWMGVTGHILGALYLSLGPLPLFALRECFPGRFRVCIVAFLATLGATAGLSSQVVPPLLGALGWRGFSVVLFCLPLAALLLLCTLVPAPPAATGRVRALGLPHRLVEGAGPALLIAGVVKGFSWGWTSSFVLFAFGAGALCLVWAMVHGRDARAAARTRSAGTTGPSRSSAGVDLAGVPLNGQD